jgi:hypothetical protein
MAFSKTLKDNVKKKAHYQCCMCSGLFIDVHHIVPQADGGDDAFENAAPLCQSCHFQYGNNRDLRAQIIGRTEIWYEICERRLASGTFDPSILERVDALYEELVAAKDRQRDELKEELKQEMYKILEAERSEVANASSVEKLQGAAVTATRLAQNVHANVECRNCGTYVGLMVGSAECPTCGAPIGT